MSECWADGFCVLLYLEIKRDVRHANRPRCSKATVSRQQALDVVRALLAANERRSNVVVFHYLIEPVLHVVLIDYLLRAQKTPRVGWLNGFLTSSPV